MIMTMMTMTMRYALNADTTIIMTSIAIAAVITIIMTVRAKPRNTASALSCITAASPWTSATSTTS